MYYGSVRTYFAKLLYNCSIGGDSNIFHCYLTQCLRAAFAMVMLLVSLYIYYIDVLCPDDRVNHHATFTRL